MDHTRQCNATQVQDIAGVWEGMDKKFPEPDKPLEVFPTVTKPAFLLANCKLHKHRMDMEDSDQDVKMMEHTLQCNVMEAQDIAGVQQVMDKKFPIHEFLLEQWQIVQRECTN